MTFIFFLSCLYYFLPGYCANMTPPIMRWLNVFNFLDKPVDGGLTIDKKPLLGRNKTWRGLILGVIVGFVVFLIQRFIPFFEIFELIDYDNTPLVFGILMPLGALLGDMFFSMIKRRIDLKPGDSWIPWDQIDYVIGSFALLFATGMTADIYVWTIIMLSTIFLHIIVNKIGFQLKISKSEW